MSSLAWNDNIVSAGSRDHTISNHDIRIRSGRAISSFVGHKMEVCGLTWSPDGMQLASGGNDNKLGLWSLHF